jgi:hypothetical protein
LIDGARVGPPESTNDIVTTDPTSSWQKLRHHVREYRAELSKSRDLSFGREEEINKHAKALGLQVPFVRYEERSPNSLTGIWLRVWDAFASESVSFPIATFRGKEPHHADTRNHVLQLLDTWDSKATAELISLPAEQREKLPIASPSPLQSPAMSVRAPKAFVSYSWDSEAHKQWVHDLATRLRALGVEATLDQWHAVPGDQLPEFMERAIRENDFVLIICTPKYKLKSDNRQGGTGYEGDVITGEILASRQLATEQRAKVNRKFVPVLRDGEWQSSLPSSMGGKYGVDLRGNPYADEQFTDLLETIHGRRRQAPPVGPNPFENGPPASTLPRGPTSSPQPTTASVPPDGPDPIRILNVIVDEVTSPRLDGTQGSALYAIPLQLDRSPTSEWAEIFEHTWKHPPSSTSMHRPGIAGVQGDRIVLDGTTIEEFREYHRDTLKGVMKETNRLYSEWEQANRWRDEQGRAKQEDHRRRLRDGTEGLSFDDF